MSVYFGYWFSYYLFCSGEPGEKIENYPAAFHGPRNH